LCIKNTYEGAFSPKCIEYLVIFSVTNTDMILLDTNKRPISKVYQFALYYFEFSHSQVTVELDIQVLQVELELQVLIIYNLSLFDIQLWLLLGTRTKLHKARQITSIIIW